jgi:chemotaxis protein MotA
MGIVGILIVLGSVMGGYLGHGGKFHVLIQPTEFLIIFGAAIGAVVISAPMTTIKVCVTQVLHALKGGGPGKKEYVDLLQMMFRLFQTFRKDGPQAIEKHIEDPAKSDIFKNYPSFVKNIHAVRFLCDTMKVTLSADIAPHDLEDLLDADIKVIHEEEHDSQHIVSNVADAMPGLGIVAAVVGVVITMGKLTQGTDVIGQSVAGALIGTFIGVLAAYGFIAPLASKIGRDLEKEGRYLKVIKAGLVALQRGAPPMVCVEYARRAVFPHDRPTFDEMEKASKEKKAA